MSSNVNWFEYKMDGAIITTPIKNVEDLRAVTDTKEVKITLCTQEAQIVFSKKYETQVAAIIAYNDISCYLCRPEEGDIPSFEDWELEVKWEKD